MFKEIRSLLQMLGELDAEETGERPAPDGDAATAGRCSALVLDSDLASARGLADTLAESGIAATIHGDRGGFAAAVAATSPALVFIDVNGQGDDAIDALVTMSEHRYAGPVQLMGTGALPVLEVVRRMGKRHALRMLPVLPKPLAAAAVRRMLAGQTLGITPPVAPEIGLEEALARNWVAFRYQPKIDLRQMQIAGVETFARVLHPERGTLPPGAFMGGARDSDLLQLTQLALTSALRAAASFSQLGINLRLAVNVPVPALLHLPIADLVRAHGPRHQRWPGLLLDVSEEQVVAELPRVQAASQQLAQCNVRLAIDDFGRGLLPAGKLRELPFLELKLDRRFVDGCAADSGRADVCRSVIELAHNLDCVAVAVGIERATDMRALAAMGCGLGQGYLFGQPMPEEQLAEAMLARAVAPGRPAARA